MRFSAKIRRLIFRALVFVMLADVLAASPVFSAGTPEGPVENLVLVGNSKYAQRDFLGAAAAYEAAIKSGLVNGHVLYNLGNAYYRLEDYGRAIAAYRKALTDFPRDPDIKANLNLARRHAIDSFPENESPGLAEGLRALLFPRSLFSQPTITLAALVTYTLFWICFALLPVQSSLLFRNLTWFLFGITLLFFLSAFGSRLGRTGEPVFALSKESHLIRPAVVTEKEAPVYSGNSKDFQVVFLLHDGAEIEVRESRDGWIEVLLPDGRRGWIEKSKLEVI